MYGLAEADKLNSFIPQSSLELRFHMRPSISQLDTPWEIQMMEIDIKVDATLHYFC